MTATISIPNAPIDGGSPFAIAYADFVDAGFSVLAIEPGKKRPGSFIRGRWCAAAGWTAYADSPADKAMLGRWASWPNAGIGIALGSRVGDHIVICVDLDTTDEVELAALRAVIPESPMVKIGARGESFFYRGDPSIATRAYKTTDGRGIADMLARKKQSVMPPSLHPSGGSYHYKYGCGLTKAEDLPFFTLDHLWAFEEKLRGLGCAAAAVAPDALQDGAEIASKARNEDDGDVTIKSINRRLNDTALERLDRWVGDLGLPKTYRLRDGRWEAVPVWRPSGTGQPTEMRKTNLGFRGDGISDFGDGERGYTAIDVVMCALGLSQSDAFGWLDERVKAFPGHYDGEICDEEAVEASAARRREAKLAVAAQREAMRTASIFTWDDQEANAAKATEWLVKGLFPRSGVSLLWGQSGSGKSFVAVDLAACVAAGHDFFAHRVKASGGTLLALGEGAGTMPDRMNAIRAGKFGGEAPTNAATGETMDLGRLPIGWMPVGDLAKDDKFRAFAEHVRRVATEMPARHGVPLRLVVVDTVVASFGFAEDPDAAAVTRAMKALDGLAQELSILIVAIHHAGKSKEAGEHGSYAWRGSAETSIQIDAERNAVGAVDKRRLFVRKNRHGGNEGWNRAFELITVELAIDEDGDPITSCVVEPQSGMPQTVVDSDPLNPAGKAFMAAFEALMATGCSEMIATPEGPEVPAVLYLKVKSQYAAMHPGGGDAAKWRRCERGCAAARQLGRINSSHIGLSHYVYAPPLPHADNDNSAD